MRFGSLLVLVVAATLVSCSSSPPSGSTCAVDADCTAGRCLSSKCFPKACEMKACGLAQVCVSETCTDEQCVDKSCEAGSVCLKGSCLPTSCGGTPCGANQVCEPVSNRCVDSTCIGVLCPAGQSCLSGQCVGGGTCGAMTCGAGQTCVNAVCVTACGATVCVGSQVCDVDTCVEPACLGVRCDAGSCVGGTCSGGGCGSGVACTGGQVCDVGTCVSPACVGVRCDGGVCQAGSCVETACVGVRCDGGVCQAGTCVDPRCAGVSCDAGTCVAGQCPGSCAPSCGNGVACSDLLQCSSRRCDAGTCSTCVTDNDCPNAGQCASGICRSGLLGPCQSTLDCKPSTLVCDRGQCRNPQGVTCASNAECISSLRCENLVCQRPRCQLQLLETQQVPINAQSGPRHANGLQPAGELYVTNADWNYSSPVNNNIRRFRVSPGDAGVVEQQPLVPNLIALPTREQLPYGHADVGGTLAQRFQGNPHATWWLPGGGPFDGRLAVEMQFVNFNSDVGAPTAFAKCGDNFYFASGTTAGRALLRFTPPNPVGSGTVMQTMTNSSVRRDNWVFPSLLDLSCTASTLYVLGAQGGAVYLARLNPLTLLEQSTPVLLPGISPQNSVFGDQTLAIVDDSYLYVAASRGTAYQVWDGGVTLISSTLGNNQDFFNANPDTLVTYSVSSGQVRRFARRMMDGSQPAPDVSCQWQ